ncbi:hypothetical protein [Gillisia mitskevichiae]|uniref:hypothetical protein n=1 Tax=Gillisia mitskevichiae TaxID=270921 RepID=UPI000EB17DF2|nr:hypothetical protein [Gillisia mitskevichiae]
MSYLASYFWIELGLTDNDNIYLGLIGVMIFGLSIGGFFAGIVEKKWKGKITLIGIFGNLILTILLLTAFIYVIAEMT